MTRKPASQTKLTALLTHSPAQKVFQRGRNEDRYSCQNLFKTPPPGRLNKVVSAQTGSGEGQRHPAEKPLQTYMQALASRIQGVLFMCSFWYEDMEIA